VLVEYCPCTDADCNLDSLSAFGITFSFTPTLEQPFTCSVLLLVEYLFFLLMRIEINTVVELAFAFS
jgi:hypothetical protein